MKQKRQLLTSLIWIAGGIVFVYSVAFLVWWSWGHEIVINKPTGNASAKGPITGIPCGYTNQRPVAVMLASDPIARPLSGIGQADLILEMPVTPNGVTRLMAVYQCREPQEIGSIRSAREGFLPYASMLNAIYAHWGGEQDTLKQLDKNILDNIDAMKYEGQYFYRIKRLKPPHNGFTTIDKLIDGAKKLGYEFNDENPFSFTHSETKPPKNIANLVASITIPYPEPYTARWEYDKQRDTYERFRDGTRELDINGTEISASVIMVLETTAEPLRNQYLIVATQGSGQVTIYQHGIAISGTWSKDPVQLNAPLKVLDTKGKEISLAPGTIWITFVTK